jgi:cohesin complex subunit SA-1/2
LISKAKSTHAFRVSLTDFFGALIKNMHISGVLYDDIALIENIQLWVTTMSSSFLRPFRHTATVVALAITTSLCRVAKEQTESTAKSLRILEGEKKGAKKAANKGRLATFQQQIDQGNERRELCENTIKDFFDTVFVHRYRDVDPKIRTDCVEALGQWVITLPSIFLEGAYLRYLGWMLSDVSGPTRHEAVKQLEKILKNTDKIAGIREFVERFRGRIVEMASRDSEIGVRTSAVDLLDLFREAGMLEPDDVDVVGKLIFDTEPRVRKAVVGFFAENIKDLYESKIEELGGEEALEDIFTLGAKDPETPRSEWITLKCLAEVLLSYDSEESEDSPSQIEGAADSDTLKASGVESRFFLAAQALYDKMAEVRDWNTLAGYLLFDHSVRVDPKSKTADIQRSLRESFKLDEKEEAVLLEILDASVKLSLAQPDEDKAKDKKKKASKAEIKEQQESIARRLAVLIPRLLSKFGANPKTTAAVLRLEQELNLSVFQALRLEDTAYPQLLHEIGVQFKGHSDQRVLSEASAALLHARQCEELEDTTEESMQTLWDDTVEDMRTRFQASSKAAGFTARGDLSVELLTEFASSVTRVSKLASIMSPVDRFENSRKGEKSKSSRAALVPIDILIEIVNRGVLTEADPDIDEIEDELVASACRSALFYFMWKARSLQESISKSEPIADIDIDTIRGRVDSFKIGLFSALSSRGGLDDLRLLATGTLLDLNVLFSTLIPAMKSKDKDAQKNTEEGHYAYLRSLAQHITPEVQEELTSIFIAAEKQYAKKGRKALEAPADDDEPEDIDSEPEDDEDDGFTDAERKAEALRAEQKLCELAGKLVLAILAGVIDVSGPLKGKLRARIQRNRTKLGPNFKEVVAYLDEPKTRGATAGAKKTQKSKAQQTTAASKKVMKSKETVEVEDDDEDDPFADPEVEGMDEDPPLSVDDVDDDDAGAAGGGDEDDIMGD